MFFAVQLLLLLLEFVTIQNASSVYGIAGPNYVDGASSLVSYDINTGKTTTIVPQKDPTKLKPTGENLGCFDVINNIYYFVSSIINGSSPTGETTVLYGYDLMTPSNNIDEIKLYQIKSEGISGTGDACIGDPNSGNIYMFGHDAYNRTNQLLLQISRSSNTVSIDVIGNYHNIDNAPLLAGDPTILDIKRDMLWVAGTQSGQELYFYINLKTGALIRNVNFHQYPLIAGSIYNEKEDSIVGVKFEGIDSKTGLYAFDLSYCDSQYLNVTKIFSPNMIGYCGQLKAVTQDYKNNILYSLLTNNSDCNNNYTDDVYLVGTDIGTGKQLTSVRIAQIDGVYNDAPYDIQYF